MEKRLNDSISFLKENGYIAIPKQEHDKLLSAVELGKELANDLLRNGGVVSE
jgi:hypothetical protein